MARPAFRRTATALVLAVVAAGCGSHAGTGESLRVVAAENFWGSLAQQLGGRRVSVASIVTDPNTDPHEYASSAVDARAIGAANEVIVNGAGYDAWAEKLLSAGRPAGRRVLTVARLAGSANGANPHLWYAPAVVERTAAAITADYIGLDPGHRAYYKERHAAFEAGLGRYRAAVARIRAKYAGTPVASTESIFVYLSEALALRLISPPAFMKAVAEGTEPPVQSIVSFQRQLSGRRARLLVFNTQTATAVTTNMRGAARAAGIPVIGISETLQPSGASFQDWQLRQLEALERGLRR